MAIQYTETKTWAKRLAMAFEGVTGRPTTIFRDGKSYRVQSNSLSNEAAEVISSLLNAGTRADRITASMVVDQMRRRYEA